MIHIRKELTVDAPLDRAFRVFTANMGAWWPKAHHIGKSALRDCVIEPRVDGRWYEVGEDGSTCDWGKVLAWDPPRRLLLAWQLNQEFQYDPDLVTEVEVTFTMLGPKRTRVDFEHRHLERFGATAERLRGDMGTGWGQILDSYARTALAGNGMKAVVIGEASGASVDEIMKVFPRHRAVVDAFVGRGEVIGIGPFTDRGNMAIFRTRAAAEAFVREDPFILEGLVKSYAIRDWNDQMPE